MTPTDHLRAARHHRNQAQAELLAAHIAAEHGDAIRARETHAEHEFHLSCAHHHEVAAMHARLCSVDRPANTPGDDAITA